MIVTTAHRSIAELSTLWRWCVRRVTGSHLVAQIVPHLAFGLMSLEAKINKEKKMTPKCRKNAINYIGINKTLSKSSSFFVDCSRFL
jgi:hypothetical protein